MSKSVKELTIEAAETIKYEMEGNYKGYTGVNAVSLYLNDERGINVNSSSGDGDEFADGLTGWEFQCTR